jgi:hypothetical protein
LPTFAHFSSLLCAAQSYIGSGKFGHVYKTRIGENAVAIKLLRSVEEVEAELLWAKTLQIQADAPRASTIVSYLSAGINDISDMSLPSHEMALSVRIYPHCRENYFHFC